MDPVTLQVMANALRAVAEEMEAALVRSAFSPNITERRDCSTALCDRDGAMVAQSASIPVHLGAMPDAVAAVIARTPAPGDVWLLNDPFTGGTHLPDLTLVSPLYSGGELLGYAISRAHHADIGGITPGSMPAGSRELVQEGLILPPVRLVACGVVREDIVAIILANSRTPNERAGDLRAQIAAHRLATARMDDLVGRWGRMLVADACAELLAYAERRTRSEIARMPDGVYRAEDVIEGDGVDDAPRAIRVAVTISGDMLTVDFAGSDPSGPGNCNCPMAVTRSAVYFVVRALTDPDIPASSGAFRAVQVSAPEGCLVHARAPSAVAAGNVETSSRIVDVVTAAFGQAVPTMAMGQGTMNNLTVGAPGFTYYETLAGGQGASPAGPGASGVHVAMSNTLNTPVEALETSYPLRVERYALRRGSGGIGRFPGGEGVSRAIRVLVDGRLSIISERRSVPPHGAAGGGDGACGENRLNGVPLPSKWSGDVSAGDVIEITTPGGGGWGPPDGSEPGPGDVF